MTIAKVAEEAAVSYAAAWRVINDVPGVSSESRRAVLAAIERVGFDQQGRRRHRRSASRRRIGKQRVVALLVCRDNTLLTASMLKLVQTMLICEDINLIYGQVFEDADLPPAVRDGQVDGVLGYGELPAAMLTPRLRLLPAVWLMSPYLGHIDEWGDRVMPDHFEIGRLAARYLLKHGHRHLAFLNYEPNLYFNLRGDAFAQLATREADSAHIISLKQPARSVEAGARAVVQRWADLSPQPTGIFLPKDGHCEAIYEQFLARGIRPGNDIQIVSCDQQRELLDRLSPPPVSVNLHGERIVEVGVQRLFHRIGSVQPEPSVTVMVRPTLDEP